MGGWVVVGGGTEPCRAANLLARRVQARHVGRCGAQKVLRRCSEGDVERVVDEVRLSKGGEERGGHEGRRVSSPPAAVPASEIPPWSASQPGDPGSTGSS